MDKDFIFFEQLVLIMGIHKKKWNKPENKKALKTSILFVKYGICTFLYYNY